MASPIFPPGNAISLTGRTQNPKFVGNSDSIAAELSLSHAGSLHADSLRGRYGALAHRGGVFFAARTTAAGTIPVITTTVDATFTLVNPTGSGVLVEPIDFQLDFLMTNAAPATANVVGFSFVSLALNAASAITKIPVPLGLGVGAIPGRLDQSAGQGYVASAITFASALTVAANWGYPMFSFPASWVPTVGGYVIPLRHDFFGKLILPPGFAMTLVASTAWGATTVVPSISWAELQV